MEAPKFLAPTQSFCGGKYVCHRLIIEKELMRMLEMLAMDLNPKKKVIQNRLPGKS